MAAVHPSDLGSIFAAAPGLPIGVGPVTASGTLMVPSATAFVTVAMECPGMSRVGSDRGRLLV